MRVAIIGAGAVGLGIGSCLGAGPDRLQLVTHTPDRAALLGQVGFRRTGLFGEAEVAPNRLEVSDSIQTLEQSRLDFVLVCTKTTATEEVASALASAFDRIAGSPRVVVFHNGWGTAEVFASRLPPERVYSARVITGFRLTDPATVDVTVHADAIRIGSLFGAELGAVAPLCERIAMGGLPCEVAADIVRDLWAKLLYNCLLNPLGALLQVPYGELGERAESRRIMEAVAHEVFAVMDAAGYATHWRGTSEYLDAFYGVLLPPTAGHESSMLQDVRADRPTEIDALCGAVSTLGRTHRVPTPVCDALAQLISGV